MKTQILRIRIEPELKNWVKQQGNNSDYVRKLIEKDKQEKQRILEIKTLIKNLK